MGVFGSVVSNESVPPEVVEADGATNDIGVVKFMVVAHPGSDESPEGLDSWIGAESADFLWLSLYTVKLISIHIIGMYLRRTGLFHMFLGASLAVNGV